ncbi:MAG: hypothetical protein ACPL5I_06390 [Thermodesulfobacteriota bacterium]
MGSAIIWVFIIVIGLGIPILLALYSFMKKKREWRKNLKLKSSPDKA